MHLGKICFLLDPDKNTIENVFKGCVNLQGIFNKPFLENHVEYWVGGTNASGEDVKKWLKQLADKKIGKRFIFPGKISQGVLGYPHADCALVPYLLNWSKIEVYFYNLMGILLSKLYERKYLFGYLVMSNRSSVGRKVGAKDLSNNKLINIVNHFLKTGISKTVYLEAGSGAKEHARFSLVKEISKIIHKKKFHYLIVGGGIKSADEIKKLFSIGVDKVVVSTILEQDSSEKSLKVMKNLIKPIETLWKKSNLSYSKRIVDYDFV